MSLSPSKFTFSHAHEQRFFRTITSAFSQQTTNCKSLPTKVCDMLKQKSHPVPTVGQQHTGGWQQASVASTRQQYPELQVVSLSCTSSGVAHGMAELLDELLP